MALVLRRDRERHVDEPIRKNILAIDIGGTKIACAIVSLGDGQPPALCHLQEVPTAAKRGGAAVLKTVLSVAGSVCEETDEEIMGIGVSSAGVINPRSGEVSFANDLMPGWGGTPLGSELEEHFKLPVSVMGDVHAHALGEARWGAGKDYDSCLVAAIGTGIGGAFVQDGTILLGAHGVAGHIGHVACLEAAGVPCACGATGHLEPIASGPGIAADYARRTGESIDGREVAHRSVAGDSHAIASISRAGHALGSTLGSLCNVVDPAVVILSGSVAMSGKVWEEALKSGFVSQAMEPVAATPLIMGALGGAAPLIGAAENQLRSAYWELRV
jgi:glucokinase